MDREEYWNSAVRLLGQVNPKFVKILMICRKSTPIPSADMFTRLRCVYAARQMNTTVKYKGNHPEYEPYSRKSRQQSSRAYQQQ